MGSSVRQPYRTMMASERIAAVLLVLWCSACTQASLYAPDGANQKQRIAERPAARRATSTAAAAQSASEAHHVAPETTPVKKPAPASIAREFRVTLSGSEQLSVNPWFVEGRPAPTKLADLEPWAKQQMNDNDPPRPDQAYTLWIKGDVTLSEFAVVVESFASRGFVHPVASFGGEEFDFYTEYVPPEAIRPVGTSLATLNVVADDQTLYLTAIMMQDQWKHEVMSDKRFEIGAVNQGASGPLADALRELCSNQRRPCDRITIIGLRQTPILPFLQVLKLVRELVPERVPVITEGTTIKPGTAARYRDGGSLEFMRMEDLIDQQEGDSHP